MFGNVFEFDLEIHINCVIISSVAVLVAAVFVSVPVVAPVVVVAVVAVFVSVPVVALVAAAPLDVIFVSVPVVAPVVAFPLAGAPFPLVVHLLISVSLCFPS